MKNFIKRMIDFLKTKWQIGGIVFTNTILHLVVGAACGLIGFVIMFVPELWIFTAIGFFVATLGWEVAQRERAMEGALSPRMKEDRARIRAKTTPLTVDEKAILEVIEMRKRSGWNWIDSLADVIAGNLGFSLVYWTIYYFMR